MTMNFVMVFIVIGFLGVGSGMTLGFINLRKTKKKLEELVAIAESQFLEDFSKEDLSELKSTEAGAKLMALLELEEHFQEILPTENIQLKEKGKETSLKNGTSLDGISPKNLFVSPRGKLTTLSTLLLLGGVIIGFWGEYVSSGFFFQLTSITASALLIIGGVGLSFVFMSLGLDDWQEKKLKRNFVNLGDGRIIAIYQIGDAIIHLPVAGTSQSTIIAPSKSDVPYVTGETIEHIHFVNQIPKVEVMDDELYEKLFGNK